MPRIPPSLGFACGLSGPDDFADAENLQMHSGEILGQALEAVLL